MRNRWNALMTGVMVLQLFTGLFPHLTLDAAPPTVAPAGAMITDNYFIGVNTKGDLVELIDGSHWGIASYHREEVLQWQNGDVIEITPNESIFSSHDYNMINKTRNNSTVKADLIMGPIAWGPHTHWVVGLDRIRKYVFLENGTVWNISSQLGDWEIYDTVILGTYESCWTYDKYALINVNMNKYVTGSRSK